MLDYGNETDEQLVAVEDAPGAAVVAVEPTPKALHEHTSTALRARVKEELAGRSLAGWEHEFCRWLALQDKKVPERDQLAVGTALAGRRVMRKEMQALKRRGPYIRLYAKEQGSWADKEVERAKAIAAKVMPRGMELAGKMIDTADEVLTASRRDDGTLNAGQALETMRAATPLVNAIFDRVHPKKHDASQVQTNITITLSTHQGAGLDAPELLSDAVDVPYEVVSEELVAPEAA